MSKSLGNHIGVTEPPEEMYGRTLSLPDAAMDRVVLAAARRSSAAGGVGPRDAQARARARRSSSASTARTRRAAAEEHFDRLFVRHEAPDECPSSRSRRRGPSHLPELLAEAFGVSRSEARQLLGQGGVKLNGEPLAAGRARPRARRLDGAVLQVGKRQFRRLRVRAERRGGPRRAAAAEHAGERSDRGPDRGRSLVVARSRSERAVLFAVGSTVAVTTMEWPTCRRCSTADPGSRRLEHNARNHDTNAHAHLRAAVIGPSESVPVLRGRSGSGPGSRSSSSTSTTARATASSRSRGRGRAGRAWRAPLPAPGALSFRVRLGWRPAGPRAADRRYTHQSGPERVPLGCAV